MSYIDSGYAVCLATLALYAVVLVARRRRIEREAVGERVGGRRRWR